MNIPNGIFSIETNSMCSLVFSIIDRSCVLLVVLIFIPVYNIIGARVISAETVPVRMYTGGQHGDSEITFTYNPRDHETNHGEFWLIVLRVFLDGVYNDPPPEVLPPEAAPRTQAEGASQDECCCNIM